MSVTHLLKYLTAVLRADVAGAVAALLRVEGLPEVSQQHRAPALDLLLAVCDLRSPQNALTDVPNCSWCRLLNVQKFIHTFHNAFWQPVHSGLCTIKMPN